MSSDFLLHEKWFKKLDKQTQQLINRIGTDRKTLDEVFDKSTLLLLGKLISDKIINSVDFPISTGKEAIVFRATTPSQSFVAIKIYRTSNMTFKHISKYIDGDPRFHSANKSRREIVYEWTNKEYKNLERLQKVKVLAPSPLKRIKNILVMEYLGKQEHPAPLLKDVALTNPKKTFRKIVSFITQMYTKADMVHADLSAYNILFYQKKPYLIDLGQGVLLEHPQAREFLKRDIHNIVTYFKKFNIHSDENKIFEQICTT
jgi:RIO kinase 1